jgi:hypothetical protein
MLGSSPTPHDAECERDHGHPEDDLSDHEKGIGDRIEDRLLEPAPSLAPPSTGHALPRAVNAVSVPGTRLVVIIAMAIRRLPARVATLPRRLRRHGPACTHAIAGFGIIVRFVLAC